MESWEKLDGETVRYFLLPLALKSLLSPSLARSTARHDRCGRSPAVCDDAARYMNLPHYG